MELYQYEFCCTGEFMKDAGVPRDKIAELAWQTRKFAIDNGF